MKTLFIISRNSVDKGVMVAYRIEDEGKLISEGERLVPNGFDRLLIPQIGEPALYAYL